MIQYPLYSISTQMLINATGKKATKSISGINLPAFTTENRNQIGNDLTLIAQALARVANNVFVKATLTTKEEVSYNG